MLVILIIVGAFAYFFISDPDNLLTRQKIDQDCCDNFCQKMDGNPCYAFNNEGDYVRCGKPYITNRSQDFSAEFTTTYYITNVTAVCGENGQK